MRRRFLSACNNDFRRFGIDWNIESIVNWQKNTTDTTPNWTKLFRTRKCQTFRNRIFFPIMNIWLDHHRSQNSSSFDIWRFRISRCTGGALMIRSLLKHCCKVQFHGKIGKKWMKFLLQQSECQCLSRWPYVQFSRLRSRLVFAETTVHILQKIGN